MKNDRIREHLDICLDGVTVSPALHARIRRRITEDTPARRTTAPRRILVIAALIVLLLVTTAAAITIAGLVRQDMEPVRQFMMKLTRSDSWLLEDKLYYVSLMEEWGFDLHAEKLALLRSGSLTPDEQEQLAGEVIWDCIAAHELAIHGRVIDPANQPEPYPIPDNRTLFEMLWLQNDPQADLETIHAAYEEWFAELHAALPGDTPVPANLTAEQKRAALLMDVDNYMADSMSMSRKERAAAEISLEFDRAIGRWVAEIRVKGSDLRDVTREWFDWRIPDGDVTYDAATDTYTHYRNFKPIL